MCVDVQLTTEVILLQSTEFIHVTIGSEDGSTITPSAVEFCFPQAGETLPPSPTWLPGEITADGAQFRIGDYAGAHALARGRFEVYVRTTVHPERPVRNSGQLTIR